MAVYAGLSEASARARSPVTFSVVDRFWKNVDKSGTCWLWLRSKEKGGYGQFWVAAGRVVMAHRFAYEVAIGPIPEGFTVDHVRARGCVHRHCVRPEHLEAVTLAENVRRGGNGAKTHCVQGHELAGSNLYVRPNGKRNCRACARAQDRAHYRRAA